MRATYVVICALLFAGCASITPSKLEPPAAVLLAPPAKLQDPKAGDDLVPHHIAVRRQYITLADKHRRLQRYVRTVLGR